MVDTPPSRSALDFLDAPARLARFLDGRMLRLLLAPARAGGRSMFQFATASFGLFSRVVQKVVGAQLLGDLSGFVEALDSMFGGFRERAEHTYRVLQDPQTGFLLVATPEADAIREAVLLRRSGWSTTRCRWPAWCSTGCTAPAYRRSPRPTASRAAAAVATAHPRAAAALRAHAALAQQVAREERMAARFTEAFPAVPVVEVPAQPTDVHDLDGLRAVGPRCA